MVISSWVLTPFQFPPRGKVGFLIPWEKARKEVFKKIEKSKTQFCKMYP
jgi:hypothetical protein